MLYTNTELAEIVCTRIAHDLGGNIGALGSALELLSGNNNELDSDTLNIISTAAFTLKARQRFLRIAFGLETKSIEAAELKNICKDYLKTIGNPANPITLNLDTITPEVSKPLFLSIVIAADVCMRGGTITVDLNMHNLTVKVFSQHNLVTSKIAIYQDILNGKKPEEYISQYIQLIYLREILGNNVPIKISYTDNDMLLVIG